MTELNNQYGNKIKHLREARGLSIEELAERCKLAARQIELIENGKLLPSLSPLIKIARALGVRLGTFLDDNDNLGPVVTRSKTADKMLRFSDKDAADNSDLDFYALAANKTGRHMEPFIIDIYPSSEDEIKLSTHEGEEFIYVLEGEVEIIYGKETISLGTGDSTYYDSIVAHHVHSKGDQPAKILAVVYAPF